MIIVVGNGQRNTKVKVRSPDGDTEYFDIVAGVLQGDTLAPYLSIICLNYILRTSIDKIRENGFELTKKRSRRHPAKTITDADYADDIAILANTPNQAETLLHSLERAAAGIGFHVNAHKMEYMYHNQTGDITTQDRTPLKLVDKFTYLGSSVPSTEKHIDTRLTKAWTAIDKLSIIWKSDLTDKMKRSFFQAAKTIKVRRTRHAGHCWRSRNELISDVLLWTPYMAGQKQDDQLEHTFSSDVRIRDVALKTYQRRWTIGRNGERGSGISVLAAGHDDDETLNEAVCI